MCVDVSFGSSLLLCSPLPIYWGDLGVAPDRIPLALSTQDLALNTLPEPPVPALLIHLLSLSPFPFSLALALSLPVSPLLTGFWVCNF